MIGIAATLLSLGGLWAASASAKVLELESGKIQDGFLRSGPIEVVVKPFQRIDENGSLSTTPVAIVRVNGEEVGRLTGAEKGGYYSGPVVQIAELDASNPYPEVLLSTFTGGAHCCNQIKVLTSNQNGTTWSEVLLGTFDGGASVPAKDPLGTGRFVVVDRDNRFLYRFAPYAFSTAPARIWELKGTEFVDVTRRPEYVPMHRRHLANLNKWFALKKKPPSPNGFLAGYVATKALVGELYDGWSQASQHSDRSSNWGLVACKEGYDDNGRCKGQEVKYISFLQALRAFLIETGYIDASGEQSQRP